MRARYLFYALRPKQWIKNLFIFLPLIFGKKLFVYPENMNTCFAFLLFSIAAGSVYIINDIIDFDKDRHHPTKRLRPIASGKISIMQAWIFAVILGISSIAASFTLNAHLGLVIAGYIIFNLLYSIILKTAVIIDIFCIALFFYIRILAGSIVSGTVLSHWILFMVVLLALFLGFGKRRQELSLLKKTAVSHRIVLPWYGFSFIDQMTAVIASSMAIVYIFYTVDARTVKKFGSDHLMISIPFVYYGIFRYLYLIHRLRKEGDPTRILLSDKMMQVNLVLWISVCIAVIYFGL